MGQAPPATKWFASGHARRSLMRRTDAFGLLGVVLLITGACLYVTASINRMSWLHWLGGPALWFAGFALLIGWGTVRFSRPDRKQPESTALGAAKER